MYEFNKSVYSYNTRHNQDIDQAHKVNLVDLNYWIHEATKLDNALRRFQSESKRKMSDHEVVRVYEDCRRLGYVMYMDDKDNDNTHNDVEGQILIITPKGMDFATRHQPIAILIEWAEYYYKILMILGAFLGGAIANVILEIIS